MCLGRDNWVDESKCRVGGPVHLSVSRVSSVIPISYPLEAATWEPRSNFFRPQPEIRKHMEELRKGSKEAESKGTPTSADRKRILERPSSRVPTSSKRPRRSEPSPPTPKSSSSRRATREGRSSRVAVEESEEEEEEEDDMENGIDEDGEVVVKRMRKEGSDNHLVVDVMNSESPHNKAKIPVEEAREKYPQQLIAYLLGVVQFRGPQDSGSTSG